MTQTYYSVQQKQLRKLSAGSLECGEDICQGEERQTRGEEAGKVVVFGIVKRYGDVKHTHCQPRSGSHHGSDPSMPMRARCTTPTPRQT
ncbi:hypothetical protein CJO92_16620 (plasmid) [Ralstonia solanacearum]|uniref:Uncharacterized protein n=1 Tax=Ralstonia solanacearum TaxID=305 RepID=A0AAD0SFQ1_RALSL|nr:hypothetical protein CJO77_16615 [Ralstonia solanacearum]AXW54381.1 hypothetical protein CJO92_16620 [Ralstonia solanacearum]